MQKELETFGLTPNDATVYLSLLDLKKAPAGEVARRTGFHRNIVYESLDRLISKRLVFKSAEKKVAQFQPTSPTRFVDEAKSRLEVARTLADEISSYAPVRSDIVVYEGIEGFRRQNFLQLERMDDGDTFYIFGSLGNTWSRLMGDEVPRYQRLMLRKGIKAKVIAYRDNLKDREFSHLTPNYEVRVAKGGVEVPANNHIWKDYIVLRTGVEPYSIIEIFNPVLAKGYLSAFEALWASSKPL